MTATHFIYEKEILIKEWQDWHMDTKSNFKKTYILHKEKNNFRSKIMESVLIMLNELRENHHQQYET